ncbi:MAG: 23S rRNA (uracil1939-C5)-methyltransferase [Myxococcota bacterium]|jgi:23S rRNA (uracil1939-C5)-methyltransferase
MTAPLKKPRKGDLFEVRITGLTARGEGEADHGRFTLAVPGALPGERVEVEVTQIKKRIASARVVSLLEASPHRIEPRCQHFAHCGGCTLQTLSHAAQLQTKVDLIRGLLMAQSLDPNLVQDPIALETPWFYRNKMEFSFGRLPSGWVGVGLHPPGFRYEVFDLQECLLQSPEAAAIARLSGAWAREQGLMRYQNDRADGFLRTVTVREGKRTGARLIELTTSHAETTHGNAGEVSARAVADSFVAMLLAADVPVTSVYWSQYHAERGVPTTTREHHLHGEELLSEALHLEGQTPLRFEIHPRAFFQPNTLGAELLYDHVARAAGLNGEQQVLDLYCGTGSIGMSLARHAASVIGIELVPDAVENARQNALRNGINNITFHAGDVAKVLEREGIQSADVIVVDPPRSGLMAAARVLVGAIPAQRLVYVSCNPASLARDLVSLHHAGWRTQSIQPFDMFPHTAHIENIAILTRPSAEDPGKSAS